MKKLLLFFIVLPVLLSCSKEESVEMFDDDEGVVTYRFVKDKMLSNGEVIEEPYKMAIVLVWRADGLDLEYNGASDGSYAIDKNTDESHKANMAYSNMSSKSVSLDPGKYFIAVLTGADDYPRGAYSTRSFEVKKGDEIEIKKNIGNMKSFSHSDW